MIAFDGVEKSFRTRGRRVQVLAGVTFVLPRRSNVAVLGRNGAGKSTLLALASGVLRPNRGLVHRGGKVSWPLAFAGGFHPHLTGRENAKFVARIYRVDPDRLIDEVAAFAEIGQALDAPFHTYSQGMKARLAFGVSMAVDFDVYLVDEIIGVGDMRFREKCREALHGRLRHAQVMMASHSEGMLKEFCDMAIVLEAGKATVHRTLDDGLAAYREIARCAPAA